MLLTRKDKFIHSTINVGETAGTISILACKSLVWFITLLLTIQLKPAGITTTSREPVQTFTMIKTFPTCNAQLSPKPPPYNGVSCQPCSRYNTSSLQACQCSDTPGERQQGKTHSTEGSHLWKTKGRFDGDKGFPCCVQPSTKCRLFLYVQKTEATAIQTSKWYFPPSVIVL